jgi:hypothetical protein
MLTTFAVTLSLAATPMVRVSVEGDGFLRFAQDGHALYSTSAPLTIVNGWLSNANGAPLIPTLRVPEGTRRVEVNADGEVFAATSSFRARVGRISLAVFRGESGLMPFGSFLVSSETPDLIPAGKDGAGSISTLEPGEPLPSNAVVAPSLAIRPTVSASDPFVQQWIQNPAPRVRHSNISIQAPRSGPATITLSQTSETAKDTYSLGDIAVIDAEPELRAALSEVVIGDTPGFRRATRLNQDQILAQIIRAGFDPDQLRFDIPRKATIRRTSQQIARGAIEQAAIQAVEKIYGEGVPMGVSFRKDEAIAPIGEVSLDVESCLPTPYGASLIVVTKVNGERFSSKVVRVSVDGASTLFRARQDLH